MRLRAAFVAAAMSVACAKSPVPTPGSFSGPGAAAVFVGWTPARPGSPWPYLAVANTRGDELRILDPATDKTLLSPGYAFPLSVPTLPSPLRLAAASLGDGQPDLLVVAGVGSEVQVVGTWMDGFDRTDPANPVPVPGSGPRVAASYDLSGEVGSGAEILSLLGAPVPGSPVGSPPVASPMAGRARVLVGASGSVDGQGGKLVVLEFRRGPGGSVEIAGPPAVVPLGFDALSLALSPDNFHVYAATTDLITETAGGRQVFGVAEVETSADVSTAWPVRGFDARGAGTNLVAAAWVGERLAADAEDFAPPVPRVYASLDLASCGRRHAIDCGIATFDPVGGGLASDPAPPGLAVQPQTYRTPLFVPAVPLALAVAMPPATGSEVCFPECLDPTVLGGVRRPSQPLMRVAPTSGQRWTTAIAAVPAADGNVYVLDLGRYSAPDDESLLNPAGKNNLRVTAAISGVPAPAPPTYSKLGLYVEHPPDGSSEYLTASESKMPLAVMLTPGFTRSEQWSLTWQGGLPGLVGAVPRPAPSQWSPGQGLECVLGRLGDGSLYLAMQRALGTSWVMTADVTSPELGVHAADLYPQGDIAEFKAANDPAGCEPAQGQVAHEASVANILPRDPASMPGGGARLAGSTPDLQCLSDALAAQPGATLAGECYLRSSGLVLVGNLSGYAGRPDMGSRYDFKWTEEDVLSGEALVLARKARRFYYAGESPCKTQGLPVPCSGYPEFTDPLAAGPVLGLKPGVACPDPAQPDSWLECQGDPDWPLPRGATILFATADGVAPMFRSPATVSLGTDAVALDKSLLPGSESEGTVIYVPCYGNIVFEALPGAFVTSSKTLR